MPRGTRLAELRLMLLAEIGDNANPNNLRRIECNTLLSNKQKWLATEYDWPFLQHQWDISCPPNTQYVALPTVDVRGATVTPDFDRPQLAWVLFCNIYQKIEYGVGPNEYDWQNFALGQASDPIQRYQMVSNTNEEANPSQIEVWPVPVGAQTIRLQGQREMYQMVADEDKADLDDMLLIYFVAADMLARKKQADAGEKLALAKQRLGRLTNLYPSRYEDVIIGRENLIGKRRRDLFPIAVAGQSGTGVQVLTYTTTDPTTDGVFPGNQNMPAIAYKLGVGGTLFTWDTNAHVWY